MAWSWRGNIRRFLKVTRTYSIFRARYQSCTQCTVRWPGAGAGGYSTNAVEYGTDLYCIIYLMIDTILRLGIWLSRISRLSRTVPVLYVTQNKKKRLLVLLWGGHRYHEVWEEPAVVTGRSTAN